MAISLGIYPILRQTQVEETILIQRQDDISEENLDPKQRL